MLRAHRVKAVKGDFEITADGRPVTVWNTRTWRTGGTFLLDGVEHTVVATFLGGKYVLSTPDGTVAVAERVGRKRWSIGAGGQVHEFVRGSLSRRDQDLVRDGTVVGGVRRISPWRDDVTADLPGLDLPVALFALVVVLSMWQAEDMVAVSSS